MLLFGIAGPQVGHHQYGMAGLGAAVACNIDSDCAGGQTCNADSGLCEDIGSSSSGADSGCGAGMYWNINKGQCLPTSTGSASTTSAGSPWWATALTALTKGAVSSQLPSKPITTPVAATPWYQTPIGIGGLVVGAIALFMLLKK